MPRTKQSETRYDMDLLKGIKSQFNMSEKEKLQFCEVLDETIIRESLYFVDKLGVGCDYGSILNSTRFGL